MEKCFYTYVVQNINESTYLVLSQRCILDLVIQINGINVINGKSVKSDEFIVSGI
jgi:hypothetical protein